MYSFDLRGLASANEYIELIKMFLRPSEFEVITDEVFSAREIFQKDDMFTVGEGLLSSSGATDSKNGIKRLIYGFLVNKGLKPPEWGILTGVRPVKLFGELAKTFGEEEAGGILDRDYFVGHERIGLLNRIYNVQRKAMPKPENGSIAVYIGIPFCPSRCEYCSFPSNQVHYDETAHYLGALAREIRFVADGVRNRGWYAETIYIGGGTPTFLKEHDLDMLLELCVSAFGSDRLVEFTVEAGRPDTVSKNKLEIMKNYGVSRVCINPQSMNDQTLRLIGRNHDSTAFDKAFHLVREAGIPVINSDIIAGLPGEIPEDFRHTLDAVLRLSPENITVHTLTLKRAAKLKEQDSEFHYNRGDDAAEMLKIAKETLLSADYEPYYLYRQKKTAGNLENIGYAKSGACCLYNMRIMQEDQTILALGAGGVTKAYFPETDRIERIFNVSDYRIYIERIDEMLERKKGLLNFAAI